WWTERMARMYPVSYGFVLRHEKRNICFFGWKWFRILLRRRPEHIVVPASFGWRFIFLERQFLCCPPRDRDNISPPFRIQSLAQIRLGYVRVNRRRFVQR